MTTLFEGGLIVIAYFLGWLAAINPLENVLLTGSSVFWGLLGTAPLILLFLVAYRLPWHEWRKIKHILIEMLGPYLSACRWYELAYVALLAGVGEEMLFRGVLQPWIESGWGWGAGLIASNVLFGLAHAVTPLYALLAGLTGAYLGWMLDVGEQRNLLIPIIIHAAYDFLAFLLVVQSFRRER